MFDKIERSFGAVARSEQDAPPKRRSIAACDHRHHLSQRVRYTAAAMLSPKAAIDAPTSANSAHAGAALAVSHRPPARITHSRTEPAKTTGSILPEPCDAK